MSSLIYGLKKAKRALLRLPFMVLLACTVMFSSQSAKAAMVNGTIEFQVLFMNVLDTGGTIIGVDFGDVPTFDVPDGLEPLPDGDISRGGVVASSGDFATAGIGPGSLISLTDFYFDLSTPGPYAQAGNFDFFMTAIAPSTGTGSTVGDFTGSGFLVDTSGGFDNTQVDWSFNANTNIIALVGLNAAPIPLPAAFWLFGAALASLAGLRARR